MKGYNVRSYASAARRRLKYDTGFDYEAYRLGVLKDNPDGYSVLCARFYGVVEGAYQRGMNIPDTAIRLAAEFVV